MGSLAAFIEGIFPFAVVVFLAVGFYKAYQHYKNR